MFVRVHPLKLQQYRISQIKATSNNRLVDIEESLLALLAEVPNYEQPVNYKHEKEASTSLIDQP